MTRIVNTSECRIAAKDVRSLVWDGDTLVDWVDGGQRYQLDGSTIPAPVRYAYPFDAAVALPGSDYAIIYSRLQTKALILHQGNVLREINRSFYHASSYEYPIAVFRLSSGREVLAHCPDEYCCLQIEDLATGEVLTRSAAREASDFFHSRLVASADGRHLVSAGWLWHPMDDVAVYSVEDALSDPRHLDKGGLGIDGWAEESSAVFLPDGSLAVALYGSDPDRETEADPTEAELRLFDLRLPQEPRIVRMPGRLGTIAAVDQNHVLALYGHPRLIDLRTGGVAQSWPHIETGKQTSSILMSSPNPPPMAFDAVGRRYAFADDSGITVLQFD